MSDRAPCHKEEYVWSEGISYPRLGDSKNILNERVIYNSVKSSNMNENVQKGS